MCKPSTRRSLYSILQVREPSPRDPPSGLSVSVSAPLQTRLVALVTARQPCAYVCQTPGHGFMLSREPRGALRREPTPRAVSPQSRTTGRSGVVSRAVAGQSGLVCGRRNSIAESASAPCRMESTSAT